MHKMLHWLSAHPATSAAEESQIPDAHETPAPVFAYRALKGILFGSPPYDSDDEDKENIAPVVAPLPTVKAPLPPQQKPPPKRDVNPSSPLQSKSPNNRARPPHPVSPSPRRRRRQSSPTKSILRTPGISTPRRQIATVTFKDIRPAASPAAVTTKLLAAKSEATATTSTERGGGGGGGGGRMLASTTADGPGRRGDTEAPEMVGPRPVPVVCDVGSVDAYLKSAEHEMKKLVRYSQRMREYARVSQQENAVLRKERDDLKRELGELHKNAGKGRATLDELGLGKAGGSSTTAATQHVVDHPVGTRARGAGSEANRLDKIYTVKAAELPDRNASGTDSKEFEPTTRPGKELMDQRKAANILTQDKGQIGDVVSKKRAVTRARLSPDRLAAAKERLRIKSEERRRALSAVGGTVH
jgi:hypothetical protein